MRTWSLVGAALAAIVACAPAALAETRVFRIDGDSAEMTFSCDVMGVVPMDGAFTRFVALIAIDEDAPAHARAIVTVDAKSITLDDTTWLGDLKGPDFFDVERFPQFAFQSSTASQKRPGELSIKGTLTLRGVVRPVTLNVRYELPDKTGRAPTMEADAELDRTEFGMTAMQPMLSDDVDIEVRGTLEPAFPPFRAWR